MSHPATLATRPRARHVFAATTLALLALGAGGVRAMDLTRATAPAAVTDNEVRIGSRTFKLPPGQWVLAQGESFTTHRADNADVGAYRALLVLVDKGQFRAAIDLSLPVADAPQLASWGDDPCRPRSGALHAGATQKFGGQQCLAVFGHADLLQALQRERPRAAQWLLDTHVVNLGPAIEVAYTSQQSASFGRLDVYLTAPYFDSDDATTQWAAALEDSVKRVFASRAFSATLPALPVLPASIQANDAASNMVRQAAPVDDGAAAARAAWMDCMKKEAARLDDRMTPANEVASAVYFRCREQEMQGVLAGIEPARRAVMSSAETNEVFEGAHRQVVDSGVAINLVLEHRAASAPRKADKSDKPAKH